MLRNLRKQIYMNSEFVVKVQPHFRWSGKAGVLTEASTKNTIFFYNLKFVEHKEPPGIYTFYTSIHCTHIYIVHTYTLYTHIHCTYIYIVHTYTLYNYQITSLLKDLKKSRIVKHNIVMIIQLFPAIFTKLLIK